VKSDSALTFHFCLFPFPFSAKAVSRFRIML
jgi:hypothetical protein